MPEEAPESIPPDCPYETPCLAGPAPSFEKWLDWVFIGRPLELSRHDHEVPSFETQEEWEAWRDETRQFLEQTIALAQQEMDAPRPEKAEPRTPAFCKAEDLEQCRPVLVYQYCTRLFGDLPSVVRSYGLDRIGAGLVYLLIEINLLDPRVPLELRLKLIEAMYSTFAAYAWEHEEALAQKLYMWFDYVVPHELKRGSTEFRAPDNPEVGVVGDALYDVITRVLAIEDSLCQWAALHGLGHLEHPESSRTVSAFVEARPELFVRPEDRMLVQQCVDGTVL